MYLAEGLQGSVMAFGRTDHVGPPVPPARPVVRRGKVMLCGIMSDGCFVPRRHVAVREAYEIPFPAMSACRDTGGVPL